MSLIGNERTKLVAAALNNTAVATIVTAVIGPVVGAVYGLSNTPPNGSWFLIGGLWFVVGLALHYSAQVVLGRLSE
jgi:hypothetical protein